MDLDLGFVRGQFPALDGEWIYLDNAGGSQILQSVLDRISRYLVESNVQLGATYEPSAQATSRVDEARRAMAHMINARDDSEVVMGPSTSMLMRVLATCLSSRFEPGDEVIVTNCDHEANIGPWVELEHKGVVVKTWSINRDSLRMEIEDLRALLSDRTQLVAVTHTSNILGTINPIREFADVVHDAGALICVDGVAYAPHRPIDVQAFDVDFYAFSFYKTYGPHYALMYGKRDLLMGMPGMNHFFITQTEVPYKFQPGNVNYELSYGMLGLTDYLQACVRHHGARDAGDVFAAIAAHESTLAEKLLSYLRTKSDVTIIGDASADSEARVPTVSFVVEGRASDSVPPLTDTHQIGIRYGDFYARRLIEYLGLANREGVVRVSMVHYNTMAEVDRLIDVFDRTVWGG